MNKRLELEQMFDDSLDDIYGEQIDICGYKYYPSQALKRLDPIAYRASMLEWADSEIDRLQDEMSELDSTNPQAQEAIDYLKEHIEALEAL